MRGIIYAITLAIITAVAEIVIEKSVIHTCAIKGLIIQNGVIGSLRQESL